ncbi:hypothetical protein QMK33_06615 [Hymenobacter sp. H14-R3]|uniref:hypothetical protein n=1 Tax=Hymenobacter sp. H14-R3 TaxID=3046308 RepID=UPI0024B87AFF|nr:hypothetical protein [Hymenobacter sp. H14-R3]MDJ0364819.1 hypothetical protein [Hymenobacter sp. H14-R3]
MQPRAQETLFFENQAGRLYYRSAGYVHLAWGSERLPLAPIQAYYEQALALLRSTGSHRILSEHGQRAPLPGEAQTWLTGNWIPRAIALANTRHCAIVEGANPMHRLSTQSVVSASPTEFVYKRFDSMQAAETWLVGLGV